MNGGAPDTGIAMAKGQGDILESGLVVDLAQQRHGVAHHEPLR